jgi:hypothetical protein
LGSILPHLYFRSGIIDPWFNWFIFLGICGFIAFRWQFFIQKNDKNWWQRHQYLLLGGLCTGLAVLTKGPTALLIALLVTGAYWAIRRFRGRGYVPHVVLFAAAAASVSVLWFGLEVVLHGTWFVREFVTYQIRLFSTPDSGHGGFFGYHFVVLLLGCFPVSLLAIPNLWGDRQGEDEMNCTEPLASCKRSDFTTWMQLLFWVVLILFSLVRTKIVHYSSLCYFPLTYLGALTAWRAIAWSQRPRWVAWAIGATGVLVGVVAAAVPYLGQHTELLQPLFSKDYFAQQNLQAAVEWHWWDGWPGLALAAACVACAVYWNRHRVWESAQIAFAGGAVFVSFTLYFYIQNIEQYTQGAAIEFYESKAREDCYVRSMGFKSFAWLFYSDKRPVPPDSVKYDDLDALIHEPQNKPVYLVAKWSDPAHPPHPEGFRELYRKNGFIFFEKDRK